MKKYKKILILGSWALKIWEAWEFDYSWSQAIKAVKEEWIKTILINPNIATVQTDPWFADEIYFYPVTAYFVEKIIKKEKPDAIMLAFWWQTALNCWLELKKLWILDKYKVKVLWTSTDVIDLTEDRKKFNKALDKIWVKYAKSNQADSEKDAIKIAEKIWYPVLVRAAFALGWLWSWFAQNKEELKNLLKKAFSYSSQVTIDESLKWWKEIEYEVVRDANDNCITVCNMENFDPMWIHTWESIVIAPSQTLSNKDFHLLRNISIKTIRHLWIIWECNIQFAYNPNSYEYRVIEVNARLSRSSALASKATWYPLAYVAAKIWLWYNLDEIKNSVTWVTSAFFEPSLDYVVMKFPKWDLAKFDKVCLEIWSEMKSVWEVMSIGKNIEEVFQKSIRNLDIWALGLVWNNFKFDNLEEILKNPTPNRVFAIAKLLKNWKSIDYIHKLTWIDKFFLEKIKNIVTTSQELQKINKLSKNDYELIKKSKLQGFSDKQIWFFTSLKEKQIREFRLKNSIIPVVKQIDTLAWEFPAKTNYLYMTYNWSENDIKSSKKINSKKILVLWSWAYRIWSSVEFDWCWVNTLKTLKSNWYETLVLNFNPETVSTDFETSDKLYFEEISLEKILDIYEIEKFFGVIVSVWWQIANNLALDLKNAWINVLWTNPDDIDRAEDRNKFSALLDSIWVDQPKWAELISIKEANNFAKNVEYPVLIRPSYVLSWANMKVCTDEEQLKNFLEKVWNISKDHPAVISKFEVWAKEIEIDWVAKNWELLIYAIWEHIENAWVHSGDATILLPAQRLYVETVRRIKLISKKIIKWLNITWPFNIQFLARANEIKVIECNLRASRSFPFVSKTTKYNFIEIATKAILWKNVKKKYNTLDKDYVWVKAAQFSFHRLKWADPKLWVEMASTGEVACIWTDVFEAFLLAMNSIWIKLPKKNILVSIWWQKNKITFVKAAKRIVSMWYDIIATKWTAEVLKENWVKVKKVLDKVHINKKENIITYMKAWKIDFVINIPTEEKSKNKNEETTWYLLRRLATDSSIPMINNLEVAMLYVKSIMLLDWYEKIKILPYKSF